MFTRPNNYQLTIFFLVSIPYWGYWYLHQPQQHSIKDAVLQGTASGSTLPLDNVLPMYTTVGFFVYFCISVLILFGRQITNNLLKGNIDTNESDNE